MDQGGIVYLRRNRLVELENELRDLKTNQRKKIAERIAEARSHGDLSENAEYDAAKEEQGLLEMKISNMENMLSRVKVINDEDMPDDEVYILSKVTVKDLTNKEEICYELVSPEEADFEQDKISALSPVGKALLGKKVGEKFDVQVPSGKISYKIIDIKK